LVRRNDNRYPRVICNFFQHGDLNQDVFTKQAKLLGLHSIAVHLARDKLHAYVSGVENAG